MRMSRLRLLFRVSICSLCRTKFAVSSSGLEMTEGRRAMLEPKRRLGYAALGVMEGHLKKRVFFLGNRYSVARSARSART
jgi:glutathione S-transferase